MNEPSWLKVTNLADAPAATIALYGYIGVRDSARGVSAKQFYDALAPIPRNRNITVRIHSPGGSVWDGLSMYSLLAERRERVTVKVDGLAASMASCIAMSGKKLIMAKNSMMMIHDPSGLVLGSSRDMQRTAQDLERIKSTMVDIYCAKSGAPRDQISKAMSEETWYTAPAAKLARFADDISEDLAIAATFDLSHFKHPGAASPAFDQVKADELRLMDYAASLGMRYAPGSRVLTPPAASASVPLAETYLSLEDETVRDHMYAMHRDKFLDPSNAQAYGDDRERAACLVNDMMVAGAYPFHDKTILINRSFKHFVK